MNICRTHLKCLTYLTLTEVWKLNATCNTSPEMSELRFFITLKDLRHTRICVKQGFWRKEKGEMWSRKECPYAILWTGVW